MVYSDEKKRFLQASPYRPITKGLGYLQQGNQSKNQSISIIKHPARDRKYPQDCGIHAYQGSTAKEKLQLLHGYYQKKMKTVILPNGTNDIL